METVYLAISRLTFDQQDPFRVHRPAAQQSFPSKEEAVAWIQEKRCGGTVHWREGTEDRALLVEAGV